MYIYVYLPHWFDSTVGEIPSAPLSLIETTGGTIFYQQNDLLCYTKWSISFIPKKKKGMRKYERDREGTGDSVVRYRMVSAVL